MTQQSFEISFSLKLTKYSIRYFDFENWGSLNSYVEATYQIAPELEQFLDEFKADTHPYHFDPFTGILKVFDEKLAILLKLKWDMSDAQL